MGRVQSPAAGAPAAPPTRPRYSILREKHRLDAEAEEAAFAAEDLELTIPDPPVPAMIPWAPELQKRERPLAIASRPEEAYELAEPDSDGSAESISGEVLRTWDEGAKDRRYLYTRDKAVDFSKAWEPLAWSREDWENNLRSRGALAESREPAGITDASDLDRDAAEKVVQNIRRGISDWAGASVQPVQSPALQSASIFEMRMLYDELRRDLASPAVASQLVSPSSTASAAAVPFAPPPRPPLSSPLWQPSAALSSTQAGHAPLALPTWWPGGVDLPATTGTVAQMEGTTGARGSDLALGWQPPGGEAVDDTEEGDDEGNRIWL